MRTKYTHGNTVSANLAEDIKLWIQKINNDFASIIIIDGGMGQGKTTLGVQLQKIVNSKFDLTKQIGVGGDKFLEVVDYCIRTKKEGIIYDEAGDLSKVGAISKFNKKMMRFFETARQYKLKLIVILPRFFRLENYLFDLDSVEFLINVHDRQPGKQGNYRVYDKEGISWLRFWSAKIVDKTRIYKKVSPLYRGHFLDLPETQRRELAAFSMAGKDGIRTAAILEEKGLINIEGIADHYNKSVEWARKFVNQYRVKAVKVIGKRRYYKSNSLPVGKKNIKISRY